MALTRITKGVIKPNENYDTHNINSTGIVTAIGLDVNGNGDISGDLNVGGVLTYEDVTSIDSVGIITARQGIHVGAGVSAVGVGTFGGIVSPYADIDDFLDVGSNIQLGNAGVVTATTFKGDGDFVDIDVDGHTNLDNVSVAGVSTFAGNINSANLTISSATPFIRLVDTNPSGQTSYVIKDTNSTLRITDYTNDVDRLTIHGNGSVFVLGNFNASSGIDITGLLTVSGNSDLNGDLDVDGHTNLDHVTIAGIATFQSGSGFDLATNNVSAGMRIINNGNGSSDGMYIGYGNANNGATRLFGGGSTSNPTVINSTGVSIPNDLDVDGHTNLDNVSVAGVTTISNNLTVTSAAPQIFLTDTNANSDYAIVVNTGQFRVRDETNSVNRFYIESDGTSKFAGNVDCLAGLDVTGTATATTFSGSGASLTNLPVADSDIQVAYTVTANGSSAYRFAGNGVVSTADDPDLYLIRGQKYRFINNSGGSHPFQIREASGGTAYSTGVTNNGASSGNIDFAPTYDSPAQLVYQCTSHSGMVGNIYLRDAAGGNINVGVTTFSENVTVSSGKKLFIGTTTEGQDDADNLTIDGSGEGTGRTGITIRSATNTFGSIFFSDATSGTGEYDGVVAYDHSNQTMRFSTASTQRMFINSNGHVTKPSQPMFAAQGSGDAISAQSALPFDSINYNIGSHWNNSTFKFTCPVTGYYYVTAHVIPQNFTSNNGNCELYVRMDAAGARLFLDRKAKLSNYGSNNFSVGGSRIVYATANQTISVELNSIEGSPTLEPSSHLGIMLMA